MRCRNCRYSLAGLAVHRCPECGRAFDPNDPSSWHPDDHRGRGWLFWMLFVAIVALALFLIAAFIPVLRTYPAL